MSPLIFALAIEPLAESIHTDPLIHGYSSRTDNSVNKISLYAIDVLLNITQPHTTIPVILGKINMFRSFSGNKINLNKNKIMPVQVHNASWLQNLLFSTSLEEFTYLGIQITNSYSSLFKANFPALLSKLQSNIQFWKTFPISLLLYLFQNIPVFLSKKFFKQLNSIVVPFLWDYKTHRIGRKHLCKSIRDGGLALPDFIAYYWPANIKIMTY